MKRLWVRLSLFFSLVTLCSTFLFGLIPALLLDSNFSDSILQSRLQTTDGLVPLLEDAYDKNNTWTGIEEIIRPYDFAIPRGLGRRPSILVFADAEGDILYDGMNQRDGVPLTNSERGEAIPIVVRGVTQGYLLLQPITAASFGGDPSLILREVLTSLLGFALLAGVVGIVAGILVSRQLTAPLSKLAETVRAFSQTNLTRRAEVAGTVEVRDVASAFNEMADALTEAERLRRSLVADVAHELRTPLSVIQANLQAILDDVYPLNKDEIQHLKEQADLLRRLVNDLHELAQAEARQLPLHKTNVDLQNLIESVVEQFGAITNQQGVLLKAELSSEPITFAADPDRIAQVLHNLIQNAVMHTPEGGSITVGLKGSPDSLQITVRDTGFGIAKADQLRVFERFYRADQSRARTSGGTGLGLAIVKAIVEMHDGSITLSSTGVAGEGTTFTLTFPQSPQHVPAPQSEMS